MSAPGEDGPRPMPWWDALLEDMAASAAEYEDRGWAAIQLHTADVTLLAGEHDDRIGLSVLVPDDEFAVLERALDDGTVESCDVYRTEPEGYVAFLLAVETDERTAVLCPGYYALGDDAVESLFAAAESAGELRVYLRRLDETSVTVTIDDPALLAPPEPERDDE